MENEIWKPIILKKNNIDISNNYITQLTNGIFPCIIVRNLINNSECNEILNCLINKNITNKYYEMNLHFTNKYNFRHNRALSDIGITIDNPSWIHNNMDIFWNKFPEVNRFLNNIFKDSLNPYNIFIDIIKKVCGSNLKVEFMKYNNFTCSKGIIRIHNNIKGSNFPYHTDGFNYGPFTNRGISDFIRSQIPVADRRFKTNQVCACIFILKQSGNNKNITLYDCLVDDLEVYKDKLNGRSHRVGTKYGNVPLLTHILSKKKKYKPVLDNGDFYIFNASRIHKLDDTIKNKRIVLACFFVLDTLNNKIIIYQ